MEFDGWMIVVNFYNLLSTFFDNFYIKTGPFSSALTVPLFPVRSEIPPVARESDGSGRKT